MATIDPELRKAYEEAAHWKEVAADLYRQVETLNRQLANAQQDHKDDNMYWQDKYLELQEKYIDLARRAIYDN